MNKEQNSLPALLLSWYEQNGRALPWRYKGGAHADPYIVLVSEIMLQQTTVKTVLNYFERFITRFPNIRSLAAASIDEVYLYWQGLGYYSRARSLHTAAQTIVNDFGGRFPKDPGDVAKLKGLGAYTTASYLALGFNLPQTVVDGNVIRIISRLYHITAPIEDVSAEIRLKAEALTDRRNPADYASAIMDLGAMICTPKNPQCLLCPWNHACCARGMPDLEQIPQRRRIAKKEITANVYLIRNESGDVCIRKRLEKGLLSGLYEFPWSEEMTNLKAKDLRRSVVHVFTHIRLTLNLFEVFDESVMSDGFFVKPENLKNYPFSTLMKKVWKTYEESSKDVEDL